MKNKWQSFYEKGLITEDRFIEMIGDSFIRRATRSEDRNEHWDILCKEGKIDVKGKKKITEEMQMLILQYTITSLKM